MKVGVALAKMSSIEEVEDTVDQFERAGLDSFWVPDHLMGLFHPEVWAEMPGARAPSISPPWGQPSDVDTWLDPFCVLATIGPRTKLPIGTCVTDGTRRRAGDLIRTMLTLNRTSRGGFILGIGAGEVMSAEAGANWPRAPARRAPRPARRPGASRSACC